MATVELCCCPPSPLCQGGTFCKALKVNEHAKNSSPLRPSVLNHCCDSCGSCNAVVLSGTNVPKVLGSLLGSSTHEYC
eukprot:scaffold269314_cov14-Tisochrysis_lutea.AAC.2